MKDIISVRSNPYYTQSEQGKIEPQLELILIHTNGKTYNIVKKNLNAVPKIDETRFIVNSELIQQLITDLQLHQKKLEYYRKNADAINSLANHIEVKL